MKLITQNKDILGYATEEYISLSSRRIVNYKMADMDNSMRAEAFVTAVETLATLREGKVLFFPTDQAEVLFQQDYIELEWKLPFERTIIQFTEPFELPDMEDDYPPVIALLLSQESKFARAICKYNWSSSHYSTVDFSTDIKQNTYGNGVSRLTRTCIGFINCENVYLHREEGAPEAVNRKREKKGKARIEPYYTCRIRGVNYDSHSTGTGSQHGYIYDVRGHFRRYSVSGKVTWVRSHQRGLQSGGPYVPKTYVVDKC